MAHSKKVIRKIFASGGGGYSICFDAQLDTWWLGLAGKERPRVAFVGTATGDALHVFDRFNRKFRDVADISEIRLFERDIKDFDAFLENIDIVYVHGGNTASLLAVWRAHQFDSALKRAYERGVVVGGMSAGAMCWGTGGTTDSFGGMHILRDGLGWIPFSISPHHEEKTGRRALFEDAIYDDDLGFGYGIANGAAILFENEVATQFVSPRTTSCTQVIFTSASGAPSEEEITILK